MMTMVEKMPEMVVSALVQETVNKAVSFVFGLRGEKHSQEDLMKRLVTAHDDLELKFDRSNRLPITETALLRRRMEIKQVFQECHDLLSNLELQQDEGAPSPPKKTKSLLALGTNKNLLRSSDVAKFERSVEKADRLLRDLKDGFTLAQYRFYLSPLVTKLLQGRALWYKEEQGSQGHCLMVHTCPSEEHGMLAMLGFKHEDLKRPMTYVYFTVTLRLTESTDIIGITAECLKSLQPLGPQFTSLADLAVGEIAQISSQVLVSPWPWQYAKVDLAKFGRICRQDPFCCKADGIYSCENKVVPSELTRRFPESVIAMGFNCHISAPRSSSTRTRAHRNTHPYLKLTISCTPHCSNAFLSDRSLQQAEEAIQTEAIESFVQQPDEPYKMYWFSAHGSASFVVSKPVVETSTSNTRRVSKRNRRGN
ncbi:hypothetical protein CFC21_043641 [Triticum aestivum]|uniref:Uncharacterized protein n=4 Tax=Triticum TaxID=4564 RepID=A0A9R1QWN3_TRITD|nr:uncharacterized protein LOC123066252 [Triticum aestivum]KAF7032474.1 hypothetical protein CFC21_043641 [Triticum aestivum]VAH83911.1 unnamed protein product [Triticum turgidum subsp. durum]